MFTRRMFFCGIAALALFALAVTAGKPPPPPPPSAAPAILYVERGRFPDYSLWVMDADGANKTEIVSLGDFAVEGAEWSPDNTKIVIMARTPSNGLWQFYLADANGANVQKIMHSWWTSGVGVQGWVPFPNGEERIVYTEDYPRNTLPNDNPPDYGSDTWSMRADGTGHCALLADPDRHEDGASVSQDGTLVAIASNYPGEYRHVELGYVSIDEANCPVVTSVVPLTEVSGSPLQGSDARGPSIDPTGAMVAVSAGMIADPGLWVIPIAGPSAAWRVPVSHVGGWVPTGVTWLDARTVVYQKYNGRKWEIFKADIHLGQEVLLATGKNSLMGPRVKH